MDRAEAEAVRRKRRRVHDDVRERRHAARPVAGVAAVQRLVELRVHDVLTRGRLAAKRGELIGAYPSRPRYVSGSGCGFASKLRIRSVSTPAPRLQ